VRMSPDFSNRKGYDVPAIFADIKKTKTLACNEEKAMLS